MPTTKNNYFNNSKVANSIVRMEDLGNEYNVTELGKNTKKYNKSNKGKDLVSYIVFDSDDLPITCYKLNRFDLAVMDAVYSIMVSGIQTMTIEMILNVMTGKNVKYCKETSKKFEGIIRSIEKLASIRIKINCTEIMRAKKKIKDTEEMVLTGSMLPVNGCYIISPDTKENKIEYTVTNKPILYQYAEELGRIISVPSHVLSLNGVREDLEFTIIKQQLIKEIEIMKNPNNNYYTTDIVYEWEHGGDTKGFFQRVGINKDDYKAGSAWRNKKSRINEQIKTVLEHLMEIDYIAGYEFKKQSNSIIGVSIKLEKEKEIEKAETLP